MRILLTGATGYIGSHLLPTLLKDGHQVVALVRHADRLPPDLRMKVSVIEADLTIPLPPLPTDIEAAYYLVHSMGSSSSGFSAQESQSAENFRAAIEKTACKQILYLSGLASNEELSEHMSSRRNVERILQKSSVPTTVLRAGIIVGSGSASFEIIRDLVEKLPLMVAPRWVSSRCQPIAIADVIFYLRALLGDERSYGRTFEIGGPEQLTYQAMLLRFAKIRGLRRWILPVPVLTPRLSSYWLLLVTTTSFSLAQALVNSLKIDAICTERTIDDLAPHTCLTYEQAVESDLYASSEVPTFGCLIEEVRAPYRDKAASIDKLWRIGGANGWYGMNWAWKLRGLFDRIFGGPGLSRGRVDPIHLHNGDAVDFWRVVQANKEEGVLLLYAEMRLPGEAWLTYRITEGEVVQRATFRPKGLLGRLYWYALWPFHLLIFRNLCHTIAEGGSSCSA